MPGDCQCRDLVAQCVAMPKDLKAHAAVILKRLRKTYPDARCELDYTNVLELAIGAILSAQCTDKRVNMVTPALFRKYRTAGDWAESDPAVLESEIRSTGFFRNKAKSIRALGAALVEQHRGAMPDDFDALCNLPGIGRKTANLLMASGFGRPGLIVDTHMTRVAGRLGLTKNTDATKIEMDLRGVVPEKNWSIFSHSIVWHGRRCCFARKPNCAGCPLNDICPSAFKAGAASH
jgi:endonuclease-3